MKSVAGIDISKASVDVFVAGKAKTFANDAKGHRQLSRCCKGADLVVMEATGTYHMELACALHPQGFKVAVVNPARTYHYAKSMGLRNKTDTVDARVLAEYGRTHELDLFVPPTESELRMCRPVRFRSDLVAQRVQGRTRRHDPALTEFERRMWRSQEAFLSEQIAQVEREIQSAISSEKALSQTFALLIGVPGVGPVTAWTILAEMRQVTRFESAKKIAAYAGVCPAVRHSGTSLRGPGKLSRQGCSPLRKALYMAAVAAIRIPNVFQDHYNHHRPHRSLGLLTPWPSGRVSRPTNRRRRS